MLIPDDQAGSLRKRARLRPLPATPDTGWRPPQGFPNLSSAVVLSIDTETKELDFDNGAGWARGQGHIVGFSVAAVTRKGERGKWYFPVRHEVDGHLNLDAKQAFAWLKSVLETPVPKIGANLIYDVGWLTEENIFVDGPLYDVQFAEALLNEAGYVNLDALASKYLGANKTTAMLYDWCAQAYGGNATPKQRENIWRASPALVGPYAEDDADLPLDVFNKQYPILEAENLTDVFHMECDLIRPLIRMRIRGARVDLDYAEQLYTELRTDVAGLEKQLRDTVGFEVNSEAPKSLQKAFDHLSIPYPKTDLGNPSFTAAVLKSVTHPAGALIRDIREHKKIASTFVSNYILKKNVNGRIHCNFHPLRGDDGGTRSGRFSSDDPNLQNIPTRSALGKKVRKAFVGDVGSFGWRKIDYSQIEYRCLAHFAVGNGANELRRKYNEDPATDYHKVTGDLVTAKTGKTLQRSYIKNINFGLLYGMGEPLLAETLGIALREAKPLFSAYHDGNPYVLATMQAAAREVEVNGYITTIMGRRSRFDLWESTEGKSFALPYDQALEYFGQRIRRAHTHKAINRRLQGSAADMMKRAMVKLFESGVFDEIGVPLLTVHDELDFDVPDDSERTREAFRYVTHVMETALPLRIPVKVDAGTGANWGTVE
jgi:DNA polymerase I-like protein with 3'-5' exonuclease and polymerase domains